MIFEPLDFYNGTFIVSKPPLINLSPRPSLLPFISDGHLALLLPLIAYWSYGLFFYYIDTHDIFLQYRLHTPAELAKKNKCSLRQVVQSVIMQHVIQTSVGLLLVDYFDPVEMAGMEDFELWKIQNFFALSCGLGPAGIVKSFPLLSSVLQLLGLASQRLSLPAAQVVYYIVMPFLKLFAAFLIIDTWQFTLHYIMHSYSFLYRNLHSVHHRLYIPYAFGALYNSLLEGFLLDTLGTGLAHMAVHLSNRESIILYTFSTLKTIDDHCGYELPYDPFQKLFPNNAVYHDIHHQHFGIKTNYAQPFFTFWDKLCGTRYAEIEKYEAEQKRIRLEKYAKYLEQKTK